MVTAKVVAVKPDGKIDLSLKQLEEPKKEEVRARDFERRDNNNGSFERMMKEFLRSSEEKLGDIKRNLEGKRN